MIKKLRYLFTLMLLLVASVSWAEEVFYTLDGTVYGNNAAPFNAYAQESEISHDGIDWSVMANTAISPWRIGGKNLDGVDRAVYSKTAMGAAITKIDVEVGAASNITVNSMILTVASDANFTTNKVDVSGTFEPNSTISFVPTSGTEWAKDSYYKITFNVTVSDTKNNRYVQLSKITFYHEIAGQVAKPTFSPDAGTYVGAQEVTISTTTDGATIYYTTDGNDPTTESNVYNGAITISQNTTLKAMAVKEGSENSVVASAEYKIVSIEHAGTEADPYTVADARNAVDAGVGITGVYVKGIVSKIVTPFNSQYGNISFNISEDGTEESDQVEAFRCFKGANKEQFTSENDVLVNDEVVLYGDLVLYNGNTYELTEGNYVVSLVRPTSTEPSITVAQTEVNVAAVGGEISINVEFQNIPEDGGANVTFIDEYDWIRASLNEDRTIITLNVDANTGAERTAELTVYIYDGDENDLVSKTINITQAAYVAPEAPGSWVLTPLADLTSSDVFVIVGNNTDTYAMSNDGGTSSAPTAVEVTISADGKTLTGEIADNIKWNISGNATDGYTFYPNGETEKWLYCTNTNNGVRVGTNDNKAFTVSEEGYLFHTATSRYVGIYNSQDWRCYTSINNNIADQTFSFYKRVAADAETVTVEFGAAGYATRYYENKNLKIPEGVTAYTATVDGTSITLNEIQTGYIPAKTAVVLKGTAEQSYDFAVVAEATKLTVDNDLQGCETQTTISEEGYKYYVLSTKEGKNPGFYYAVEGGASVNCAANRAYLAVPSSTSTGAKGYPFEDDATGIEGLNVNDNMNANEVYDLQGRRMNVNNMPKGIYIVNGKKVVIK